MKYAASHASTKLLIAFVISCLLLTAPALAARPTVIKSTPETGAAGVDPTVKQIVIEFDQDMQTNGGHSICGGGKAFPKLFGKPRWQDKRTFIINVRLVPNHDYAFSINCPSYQNTRSAASESVVPYRITFKTGAGEAGQQEAAPAEQAAPALRPTVVKTTPETGAVGVDPTLKRIVIEFDQDMQTNGGHSICGGGDAFPKLAGKPRWQDKRTFIINVRLVPNHDYAFSINCPSYQNTRSAAGESVVPYRVTFRTGDGEGGQEDLSQAELNASAIDVLKEMIDEQYAYRDRLGLNWDELFEDHKQMLLDTKTPKRFAQIAGIMLAHAQDKHIWLDVEGSGDSGGGERISSYMRPMTPNANAQQLPNLVPNFQQHNNTVYTGQFDDGIGYLRIDSWSTGSPRAYEALYRFLGEHPDAPGIIIDVRFNGGGGEDLAGDLAGCFIYDPVVYAKHVSRDPASDTGFTPVRDRTLHPNTGRPKFAGKVAVLSGPVVMSSCEAFILMMKQAPNATVLGQPTQGCSGNPRGYDLGNGVTVYLPSWKAMRPDGTVFEGQGIQPDVLLETQPTDFTNNDPVLDAALNHLRQ